MPWRRRAVSHLGEIRTRGERTSRAGQDEDPNVVVHRGIEECIGEIVEEFRVERIETLGAIERDDPDSSAGLSDDGSHAAGPYRAARAGLVATRRPDPSGSLSHEFAKHGMNSLAAAFWIEREWRHSCHH